MVYTDSASKTSLKARNQTNQNLLECFSSGSETQSDTSSERNQDNPLLRLLSVDDHNAFVIDSQAGLTGRSLVAQFPCVLTNKKFCVWIGLTEYASFGKSTLMNLTNFATTLNASDLCFIID